MTCFQYKIVLWYLSTTYTFPSVYQTCSSGLKIVLQEALGKLLNILISIPCESKKKEIAALPKKYFHYITENNHLVARPSNVKEPLKTKYLCLDSSLESVQMIHFSDPIIFSALFHSIEMLIRVINFFDL